MTFVSPATDRLVCWYRCIDCRTKSARTETHGFQLEVIHGHHLTLTWSDNTVIAECETLGLSVKWTAPSDRITAQVMEHGRAMVLEQAKQLTAQLSTWSREEKGYGP